MLSMKEAIENYVEGCVGKVDCPAYKLFMKAILAGMMIHLAQQEAVWQHMISPM